MSQTLAVRISCVLVGSLLLTGGALAKDVGPANAGCDQFAKSSTAWLECARGAPAASGPAEADAQLFYAGYWLAKNGRYNEALSYLNKTKVKNTRVLTYIGFATRKLGNVEAAMGYYEEALHRDPKNDVARSYLGEAHLSRGDLQSAVAQLKAIENGCGRTCAPYAELAAHIAAFEKG
ncbi:MAG: tetratricopeptide repeat protein [Filomicrobium sp.]